MAIKYIDRRGTDSLKWDDLQAVFGDPDLTAMWVADMDFEAAPCIKNALRNYVDNVPFGYYKRSEDYYDAFIAWEKKYHGYEIQREWICFAPGVVPAFFWLTILATKPGDGVITLTPAYSPMLNAVVFNDRKLVMCDLVRDGMNYSIDFELFEKDIIENDVKVFLFCSPHNPIGRIWKADEIRRLMEICRKHEVLVISDEIHADFEWGENKHIPTATLGDYDKFLVTLRAVSKTFNIAATQNSFVIIPDEELRAIYKDFQRRIQTSSGNAFGYIATQAALENGRPWFEEVRGIIYGNYGYVKETFAREIPEIGVADLQGTYLLWLDFGKYLKTQEEVEEFMEDKCRVAFDYGSWFGGERFASFVRMNLATSRENVEKVCEKIVEEVKKLREQSIADKQ
ncbi:MAG: pyridoxal phosphate-dependent aminotransferase [Firmicutes bacterium]|nr:pyridoxal phosphate-dependent aminotransferase [Bacillota bacterium]